MSYRVLAKVLAAALADLTIAPMVIVLVVGALSLMNGGATQAEAAPVQQCNKHACMTLDDSTGVATVRFQFNATPIDKLNVRIDQGDQDEICISCGYTITTQPGRTYEIAAQACYTRFASSSDCTAWSVFHYTAPPLLQVILAPPGADKPPPVKALGRTKGAASDATSHQTICDLAKQARGRNSPAAPGLEAKCAAFLAEQTQVISPNGSDSAVLQLGTADLTIVRIDGPTSLSAGLSGTYSFIIGNVGDLPGSVEVNILFAGALTQTGQVGADSGLSCDNVPSKLNADLHCTGGRLNPKRSATITVQAFGVSPGAGSLTASANNSRSLAESDYSNNLGRRDVTVH